ncbi:DUF2927 domain-containing protein [Rhodobacter sp. Har01]|uniref:DUF2927 domain-containing protein n=1 Tax=Rhodobacter sp. Har01 TaxID=2883999 RepID=UPI001D0854F0|nr:DUF2927 domain-containing protein [Rhodobacter sp. Har01]MCB6177347.1 DUF2927 domain-containing protein [Rhodobacter sp. Har01]
MRKVTFLAVLMVLASCAPAPDAQVTKNRAAPAGPQDAVFAAPAFAAAGGAPSLPGPGGHGTAELAATFLDLTFQMESGRTLPGFSRFDGPITVALTGQVPPLAAGDLARVVARLQSEAGLDIRSAAPGEPASITIEFRPKAQLRRLAPTAACFVVPNVGSLAEFRAARGTRTVDWAAVTLRTRAAIFVPSDTSPQEVRDCLHEELAQAIGPLNDLYRLPDSVFNDDNFHAVLTPFDMLMLRATYAPELAPGMSRGEVAARIGGIFARLNPDGGGLGGVDLSATPKAWTQAIETALGSGTALPARRNAADRALALARAQGWQDGRLAFSHFAVARLYVGADRSRAVAEFSKAAALYARLPGGAVQIAHIDMQLAAIALASGRPDQAIGFADRSIPVVRATENAALLATLTLLKAEALDDLGQPQAATRLRLDSQDAARYGFGSEAVIRQRTREIAALGAQGSRG